MIDPNIPAWPDIPVPLVGRIHDFDTQGTVTRMESGRARVRRDALAPRELINVRWNFTEDQYETFKTFFEETLENGTLSFSMETREPSETEGYLTQVTREVVFFQSTYTFARGDNLFSVTSTLEVKDTETQLVNYPPLPEVDVIAFLYFDGPVYAILPYGDSVYVSGRFTSYGRADLGWTPCKGICRIGRTGALDTTFQPGGVAGGGFDISGGYFAPTQLQGAIGGGVFCGMSYAYLGEPLLYSNRAGVSYYDRMSLNGTEVPPLIKLDVTGVRDTSFVTAYLLDMATLPKFMSFHIWENGDSVYTTLQENVVSFTELGVDYGGENYSALRLHRLDGTFVRRAHRRTDLTSNPANTATLDPSFLHTVFVDEDVFKVYWSGQRYNSEEEGGLVTSVGSDPEEARSQEWYLPCLLADFHQHGVFVFDPTLTVDEAGMWAGYTLAGQLASVYTTFIPEMITRGCFRGSLVGSAGVFDLDVLEGSWRSSEAYRHKGCLHFGFDQVFTNGTTLQGSGSVGEGEVNVGVSMSFTFNEWSLLCFWSDEAPGASGDLFWMYDEPEEMQITGTSGENVVMFQVPEGVPSTGSDYKMVLEQVFPQEPVSVSVRWRLTTPAFRDVSNPTDLWDLRGGGSLLDPSLHGFSPFSGYVVDSDGCANTRVLKAMYDGTSTQATLSTSNNLGVFITGAVERFKGSTIANYPGQLFKIKHSGDYDSTFAPPEFGPQAITLKENIATGADEVFENKIMCATISSGGNVLYVGGRFTDLSGQEVGHICCLNINTGERL